MGEGKVVTRSHGFHSFFLNPFELFKGRVAFQASSVLEGLEGLQCSSLRTELFPLGALEFYTKKNMGWKLNLCCPFFPDLSIRISIAF